MELRTGVWPGQSIKIGRMCVALSKIWIECVYRKGTFLTTTIAPRIVDIAPTTKLDNQIQMRCAED